MVPTRPSSGTVGGASGACGARVARRRRLSSREPDGDCAFGPTELGRRACAVRWSGGGGARPPSARRRTRQGGRTSAETADIGSVYFQSRVAPVEGQGAGQGPLGDCAE